MNSLEFLVRVFFDTDADGRDNFDFINVSVPLDCGCSPKEYIIKYVKDHTPLDFSHIAVYSLVDSFYCSRKFVGDSVDLVGGK